MLFGDVDFYNIVSQIIIGTIPMNTDRQYLFPSGASHFLGCLLATGMLGMTVYDLLSGHCASLREGNVSMDAIMVFLLLAYTSMIEACMMITTKGYLFAYNVDKAICVPIKDQGLTSSVSIGQCNNATFEFVK